MGIISGLDVDDTLQIVGIVVVGGIVLLAFIGIVLCCRSSDEPASKLRNVEEQKLKYAPSESTDRFAVLVFIIPHWQALLSASAMHAAGADMRLKQLIAKSAARHEAYYIVEGDNTAVQHNRKVVVSKNPSALLRVAEDVVGKTMLTDFSNNLSANQLLGEVYKPTNSPSSSSCNESTPATSVRSWSGLELLVAIHFGAGMMVRDPAADGGPPALRAEGGVVESAIFLAEALALNCGHCALTSPYVAELDKKATPHPYDRRLSDLSAADIEKIASRSSDLGGVSSIKKWALAPANATSVMVNVNSNNVRCLTPRGVCSTIPLTPTSSSDPPRKSDEDAVLERILHRRQQNQQISHPNEVQDNNGEADVIEDY